jgi:2'-hydroxyisoflavone reductase
MPITRRVFMQSTFATALLAAVGRAAQPTASPQAKGKPMRILILGGTGFLGPAIVEDAKARGHSLTLFNRGKREKTKGTSFDDVEKIYGNRDPNKSADDADPTSPKGLSQLEALVKAGKKWDVVIDTSGFAPRIVKASADLLAPVAGLYVFISTISVYAANDKANEDESGALGTIADPTVETMGDHFENYGPLKALCEKAAETAMPGHVLNIRPGFIVGVRDDTDRFTYWPVRMSQDAQIIIPGEKTDPVQYIDVRDLAAFILNCSERKTTGVFNASSPAMPWSDIIDGCAKAVRSLNKEPGKQVWIPNKWLVEHGVHEGDMPIYVSPEGEDAAFHKRSVAKALAAGLTIRPAEQTCREILQWWPGEIERRIRVTKELKEQAERGGKPLSLPDPTQLRAGPSKDTLDELLKQWHTDHPG